MSASSCVSYALKMMKKRKVVIVPTLRMKLACSLSSLLPGSLVIPMVAHQQHKKMG
jgi:short-subunit dehydrogenase